MNIKHLDLNLLKVFHSLYESRSISATAEMLGLSQPGMSHTLKRLRTQTDDTLFLRAGNTLEPTAYAHRIAAPIKQALNVLQAGLDPEPDFDPATSQRRFKLMIAEALEPILMPSLMASAYANLGISFELVQMQSGDAETAVSKGMVDLAVQVQTKNKPDLWREELCPVSHVLTYRLGHPITQEVNPIAAAGKFRWLLPDPNTADGLGHGSVPLDQAYPAAYLGIVPSLKSFPEILRRTDAISVMPKLYAQHVAPIFGLGYIGLPQSLPDRCYAMAWHQKAEADPAISWLRSQIRTTIAQSASEANRV